MYQHDPPETVALDKSDAHTAALKALNEETGAEIESRRSSAKYLNNVMEQDHRAVKWQGCSMRTLAGMFSGIKLMWAPRGASR